MLKIQVERFVETQSTEICILIDLNFRNKKQPKCTSYWPDLVQLPLCLLLSVVCGVEYSQLAAEDPPSEDEALSKRADLGGVGRDSFSASSESSDEAAAAAMAEGERGH